MRIELDPSWIGAAISTAAAGATVIWPSSLVGYTLFGIAGLVFLLGIRVEGSHLKWTIPNRKRAVQPIIGMILSATAFIACGVWYTIANRSGVRLMITNVQFDQGGPTEFYVDFRLSNLGTPTTLEDWTISVMRSGKTLWEHAPRVTFMPTYNQATRGLDPPINLSKRPIATGEQFTPHFTWTYDG